MSAEMRLPEPVLAWLERVDAHWRAGGVDVATRARLGSDLADDLRTALVEGAEVADLTAEDPEVFADQVANADSGHLEGPARRDKATPREVVLTGVAGGAVGGLLVWLFMIPVIGSILFSGNATPASETAGILLVYLVSACTVVGCIVTAIAWRFRDDPRTRRWLWFVGPGVTLSGAASIAPAIGLAWLTAYSTSAGGLVLVGGVVLGFVAAGIRTGLWLAEHTRRREQPRPVQPVG